MRLSPLAATVQGQGALRCVGRGGLTTKRGDGVRVTRELIGISDGSQTLATPFKDRRVRLALYDAIDTQALKTQVMRGLSVPTGIPLPNPSGAGIPASMEKRPPYDVALAQPQRRTGPRQQQAAGSKAPRAASPNRPHDRPRTRLIRSALHGASAWKTGICPRGVGGGSHVELVGSSDVECPAIR